MKETVDFDVIIMGGGLVGATLAACLARDPETRIALVEKFPTPQQQDDFHPSFDARNTALTNGTCHLFDQLGLWKILRADAEAIKTIVITNQGGFGSATIRAEEERVKALGYVIENRFIGAALMQLLHAQSNVNLIAPAEINAIHYLEEARVSAHVSNGQTLSAKLLVVADGALSSGRQLLGIQAKTKCYEQVALVTAVQCPGGHHNTAYERFTPKGPLAILPQTNQRFGLTWCMSPEQGEAMAALSEDEFLAALEHASGGAINQLTKVGQRSLYPLSLVLAKEQIRPNVAVLGNAAHSLHPVAGQGLNMALRDVVALVQTLSDAKQQHLSWGEFSVLSRYLAKRAQDQLKTTEFSDKVTQLFCHPHPAINLMRNSGLMVFDWLSGTKGFVARHAMGRSVSMQLPEVS